MTPDRKTIDAARKLKTDLERMLRARDTLATAARDFQSRYRKWCLVEAEAEFSRDFCLVRMVQDTSTGIFFSFIEQLTHEEKKASVVALSKGMNWPESLSVTEAKIYDRYIQHWSTPLEINGVLVSALRTTPSQLEIQEKFLKLNPSRRMIAQSLRQAIKSVAAADFGRVLEDKPSLLLYEKLVGPWYVITAFEFRGHAALRYAHHIHALSGGESSTRIYSGISILGWMGIHADTTWSWLVPENAQITANAVHQICAHFLHQAQVLLGELENPA